MSENHPERVLDPVCGMTVDVERAEANGLVADHDSRRFAFCRAGCLRAFQEDPAAYAVQASAPAAAAPPGRGLPVIDAGIRQWYDACPCCLSETYPEIKATLDAERAASATVAGPAVTSGG